MQFSITRLLPSALPLAALLLSACGGGGGGGGNTGTQSVAAADVIGTWKLATSNSVNVSSNNISLVVDASTYTLVIPVSSSGQSACTEYGTWSVSGGSLVITPTTGSTCGNSTHTEAISVSGTTMTLGTSASGIDVYQKQAANSVAGNALVGTWKTVATGPAGNISPNASAITATFSTTTYSTSSPSCSEAGTWSVSGSTLSFNPNPGGTCNTSTYNMMASLNNPLLTLTASGGSPVQIWQKQAGASTSAPASTVAAGNGGVNISWQLVSGATSYNVYRGTVSGTLATKSIIGNVHSGSYLDATAVAGTTYYYQITSVDSNGESAPSAEMSVKAGPPAPSPVTGLTVTPGDAQATLSWNAVSGATSYNIYYTHTFAGGIIPFHAQSLSTTPASYLTVDWNFISGTNITSPGYTVTGLINGDTYQFMVTAVNANGEGLATIYVETVPVAANPIPAPVTGLTATTGVGQIALSWTAASGATSYNIYYNHYATASGSIVVAPMKTINLAGPDYYSKGMFTPLPGGANITSPGMTVTGLTTGDTYQFIVTPVNATGEGLATIYIEAVPQ